MPMLIRMACIAGLISSLACAGAPAPDTILFNGKIFTSNPAQPWARAVAITGDRIVAVGDDAAVTALAGASTRRIDAGGRTVVPGFNDAHTHIFITPPFDRLAAPFDPTLDQLAEALRAQIKTSAAGRLIQGEFGASAWDNPAFTRAWLDAIAPDHPVWLTSFTGHGALLNSKALAFAGIGEDPPAIEGGVFGRDAGRRLNGRLEEYAQSYANLRLAQKTEPAEVARLYQQYAAAAGTFGITSTQLLGDYLPAADASKALVAANAPMRWRYFRFPIGVNGETLDSKSPP